MRRTRLIGRVVRSVLLGFAFMLVAAGFISCTDEDEGSTRHEYIRVYPDPFKDFTATTLVFGVSGGEQTVYVRSNIDFTAHWENSGTTEWVTVIDDNGVDSRTGCRTVKLWVDPRSTSSVLYTKRTGSLVFTPTDPSLNYNVFITCNQGSVERFGTDFSWLTYGSTSPSDEDGTLIEDWTTYQKSFNYTSTVIVGEEHAYCYGRNGFIQLGDNAGHGADLITPTTTALYQDSLLVVSFNAVAYVNPRTGQYDNNNLTVEVTGGGVIQDYADENRTSMQFTVPFYDIYHPENTWVGTSFLVFVKGTDASPLTASTKIRLISGSMSSGSSDSEGNNRIFIDNLYVYSVGTDDEDYFKENGGSGLDFILAN